MFKLEQSTVNKIKNYIDELGLNSMDKMALLLVLGADYSKEMKPDELKQVKIILESFNE